MVDSLVPEACRTVTTDEDALLRTGLKSATANCCYGSECWFDLCSKTEYLFVEHTTVSPRRLPIRPSSRRRYPGPRWAVELLHPTKDFWKLSQSAWVGRCWDRTNTSDVWQNLRLRTMCGLSQLTARLIIAKIGAQWLVSAQCAPFLLDQYFFRGTATLWTDDSR